MDAANKQGSAALDDILEELKSGSKPLPEADDGTLDSILAELGLGAKPGATPVAPERKDLAASVPPARPTAQETTAGAAPAARPEPARQQAVPQTTAAFAPVQEPAAAQQAQAEAPAAESRGKPDKKGSGKTTILDIEPTHQPTGPRVGKAAALDKVDRDKFAGDTELLSWFSGEEEPAPSRKEQKKADKERRRQEAADKKTKKQRGRQDEGEYLEIPTAEELIPSTEEEPPVWDAVPQDDVVTGSAFGEEGRPGADWPDGGSLFDTGGMPDVSAMRPATPKAPATAPAASSPAPAKPDPAPAPVKPAPAPAQERPAGAGAPPFAVPGAAFGATAPFAPVAAEPRESAAVKPKHEEPNTGSDVSVAQATAVFAAVDVAPPPPAQGKLRNTQSFEMGEGEEDPNRVPTAAFTQEFETAPEAPEGEQTEAKTLFLDDMVDDRFREFFSETVIVEREELEQSSPLAKRKKKRSRTALITGEFAKLAEQAEAAAEDEFEDYNHPEDAGAVEKDLAALKTNLTRRVVASGVMGLLLLWMGFAYAGVLPIPAAVSPTGNLILFSIVYIALVLIAIVVNFTTIATGLIGLVGEPTVDTPPALATVAALLQAVVLLVQALVAANAPAVQPAADAAAAQPETAPLVITLFGGVAALLLCFNAFGKRVRARAILDNFGLVSAGFDHSAAYVLDGSHELAYNITKGLEESDPALLVSRPTALVKGFLRQSFSQHWSDKIARILGWVLLGAALLAGGVTFVHGQDLLATLSVFAAVFCIGAPLSSSLVSAVPASLLQHSASKVGAVVPGWSAIEELGTVNVVMATARDIFPPASVQLRGIKTFQKERIDLAILYAASVLIEGCETMRDIFLGVIQGKSDMLYKVESLVVETGRGFTAWVENSRVIIGNREMLQKHDIDPPPIEVEMKYVNEGSLPVYLAVSGKLFAMFVVGYKADFEVEDTLEGLVKSGVSLLVKSEDMNVTSELIETLYHLPPGVVKVLGRRELDMLGPLTEYMPESPGVMTHIGSFTSFIGGMRAAAGCAAAERMSGTVQIASVALAALLSLLLVFSGGLAGLSIPIVLLYQLGWTVLISALPFIRRY